MSVRQVPANAVHVARSTAGLSWAVLQGLVTTAFPRLSMPVDRVDLEAWLLGHDPATTGPATARRRTRSS